MKFFNKRIVTDYLCADKRILQTYREVEQFSGFVTMLSLEQKDDSSPVSRGALYKQMVEAVTLHRAIFSLCSEGWTSSAQIFLRTLMDITINTVAIIHDKSISEYMAFRFFFHSTKKFLNDAAIDSEAKKSMKSEAERGIDQLPEALRQKARDFLYREPEKGYWYAPIFLRPKDVLEKYGNEDVLKTYGYFSGASHGGFIGSSTFKDAPDEHHPFPRKDQYSQNLALVGTSRSLLELTYLYGQYFNLAIDSAFAQVKTNLLKLKDIPVTKK